MPLFGALIIVKETVQRFDLVEISGDSDLRYSKYLAQINESNSGASRKDVRTLGGGRGLTVREF